MDDSSPSPEPAPAKQLVREVLRAWDPEGLIELDLPEKEYEPEVKEITRRVGAVEGKAGMINLLREVFSQMLGRDYSREECEKAGKRLYQKLSDI